MNAPGAGEDDAMSSSSSLILFRRAELLGPPLLAADMLGRKGELWVESVSACVQHEEETHLMAVCLAASKSH
jgi:hypothetical protein